MTLVGADRSGVTTSTRTRVRRNRITRTDAIVVAAVAVASGVAAALAGAHPTAWAPADAVLSAALGGAVAWCAASAPWWLLAGSAALAAIIAPNPVLAVIATVGFLGALVVGGRAVSWPAVRAVSGATTINVLMRWELDGFHGSSAIVTALVAVLIVMGGVSRRGRYARYIVKRMAIVAAGLVVIVVVGIVVAGLQAASALRNGERELRAAASALRRGEVVDAADRLERSRGDLGRAADALDRPWAKPALAMPVVGQHVDALARLTEEGEQLAEKASVSVAQVNVDSLRVVNGAIDLNAIEVLVQPFEETSTALAGLAGAVDDVRNPWLIAPVGDRVEELGEETDELVRQTGVALDAVRLAPSMLGGDEPRTYFVMFTTPAEARGLGGFMGAFAELRADNGRLEVVRSGQTRDLTPLESEGVERTLDGPPDYLARYGPFGAGGGGEPASDDFWSNFTISPDFPSITEVAAQLYPQSGGSEIDGAIAMDVSAISRFLDLTGSIRLPDRDLRLSAGNVEEYLLREQYAEIDDDRVRDAVLEELTTTMLQQVFGTSLPAPRVLADTLGPAMAEARLVMWSLDEADQELLTRLGISGALPPPEPDGLAVVSTNAAGNKLDAYLRRAITYEGVVDEGSGVIRATATINLRNEAPDGLPEDAGGNLVDLPFGTNRMYLSVYSPLELVSASRDGESFGVQPGEELGWHVYSTYATIPRGGEMTFELGFEGQLPDGMDADEYELVLRSQALAIPDSVRVDVRSSDGDVLARSQGVRAGVQVIDENTDLP